MEHKPVLWLVGYFLLICAALGLVLSVTVHVDPFFHYHKPYTNEYYYPLNNQRSQNNGIVKHFDYTGLFTGNSYTENFKTSEAESLWGGEFIKVSLSGSSYKENNDIIEVALQNNPDLKTVIRGLGIGYFVTDPDWMRHDLGEYPTYLYDNDVFNDVQYIFNRDVVFSRVYPMIRAQSDPGFKPGITSFDEYSYWMTGKRFGKKAVIPEKIASNTIGEPKHLPEARADRVHKNITQNVTDLAGKYPSVTFYCFFTPYSAEFWRSKVNDGTIYQQVEAERIAIEEILKYPNIKLYSFNCRFDITTDLNNYKDSTHYGEWINSLMLRCMYNDQFMLTEENYETYLADELQFYLTYDYTQLNDQPDYDNDYYAAFLLAEEAYGLEGQDVDITDGGLELRNAELTEDQHDGKPGILCTGRLQRKKNDKKITAADYMRDTDYVGFKITIDDITPHKFISFYGKKISNRGQPTVCVYNREGTILAEITDSYQDIKDEWKQYVINVSDLTGEVDIIFNGGYVDKTGSPESKYMFSNIKLY